jgi:putative membrane protein
LRRYSVLYARLHALDRLAIIGRNRMPYIQWSRLSAFLAALSMAAFVMAQGTPPPATSTPPSAVPLTTPSPPAPGSTGIDRGMGTGASAKPGSLAAMAKSDGAFVRDAAHANKAEVALGNLAQTRAASASVKAFGQKMVTDHTKGYDDLAKIADAKSAVVPAEPNAAQKRAADKLGRLSGAAFDREFAKVMVADHKKAVGLFKNEASSGRDPDLKAFATSTLPTLEEHLRMAEQLAAHPNAKM